MTSHYRARKEITRTIYENVKNGVPIDKAKLYVECMLKYGFGKRLVGDIIEGLVEANYVKDNGKELTNVT